MSKSSAGGIATPFSSHEKVGPKPQHPDVARWTFGFVTLVVWITGWWGTTFVAWYEHRSETFQLYMLDHGPTVVKLLGYFYWSAVVLTGYLVAGLIAVLIKRWRWKRALAHATGSYLQLVLPRPQGAGNASTNTNPDAPFVFWDRVLNIVKRAENKTNNAYLAVDLWGNNSGRVDWGVYLPACMNSERDAIRRLITAERPQARLVEAYDPLTVALELDRDEAKDTGERWYANALLTHAVMDYYPLATDGLTMPTLVSTLRPRMGVMASGVSLVVEPAHPKWAKRVSALTQRWLYVGRHRRSFDKTWTEETEVIRMKAQQTYARMCVRVQVVAKTKTDAVAERDALITALVTSERAYTHMKQVLAVRESSCVQVCASTEEPAPSRRRVFGHAKARPAKTHAIPLLYDVRGPVPPALCTYLPIPFFPFC